MAKTVTSMTLGAGLAREGYRVLMIDSDPQRNLTRALGVYDSDNQINTLTEDIMSNLNGDNFDVHETIWQHEEGMDFIPSNIKLANTPTFINSSISRDSVLKEIIEPLRYEYDFIIIDCPPELGILTINDLVAADEVIIPTEPEDFSAVGIMLLLNTINTIKTKNLNPSLMVDGILVTQKRNTRDHRETIDSLREGYKGLLKVFEQEIPLATKVSESTKRGVSIFKYAPKDNATLAYLDFVREVIRNGKERIGSYDRPEKSDKNVSTTGYVFNQGRERN